ncbi:hypothetical protein F5Y17DRAFT_82279 [Xylariaceae sp. FL0594]|nr:hypothetical protein F5Y17DRAFT_82279 [Xylariaceae sp. FL0594]
MRDKVLNKGVRGLNGRELVDIPMCANCFVDHKKEDGDGLQEKALERVDKGDGGLSRNRWNVTGHISRTPARKGHHHHVGGGDGAEDPPSALPRHSPSAAAPGDTIAKVHYRRSLDPRYAELDCLVPLESAIYVSLLDPLNTPSFRPSPTKPIPAWMQLLPQEKERNRSPVLDAWPHSVLGAHFQLPSRFEIRPSLEKRDDKQSIQDCESDDGQNNDGGKGEFAEVEMDMLCPRGRSRSKSRSKSAYPLPPSATGTPTPALVSPESRSHSQHQPASAPRTAVPDRHHVERPAQSAEEILHGRRSRSNSPDPEFPPGTGSPVPYKQPAIIVDEPLKYPSSRLAHFSHGYNNHSNSRAYARSPFHPRSLTQARVRPLAEGQEEIGALTCSSSMEHLNCFNSPGLDIATDRDFGADEQVEEGEDEEKKNEATKREGHTNIKATSPNPTLPRGPLQRAAPLPLSHLKSEGGKGKSVAWHTTVEGGAAAREGRTTATSPAPPGVPHTHTHSHTHTHTHSHTYPRSSNHSHEPGRRRNLFARPDEATTHVTEPQAGNKNLGSSSGTLATTAAACGHGIGSGSGSQEQRHNKSLTQYPHSKHPPIPPPPPPPPHHLSPYHSSLSSTNPALHTPDSEPNSSPSYRQPHPPPHPHLHHTAGMAMAPQRRIQPPLVTSEHQQSSHSAAAAAAAAGPVWKLHHIPSSSTSTPVSRRRVGTGGARTPPAQSTEFLDLYHSGSATSTSAAGTAARVGFGAAAGARAGGSRSGGLSMAVAGRRRGREISGGGRT